MKLYLKRLLQPAGWYTLGLVIGLLLAQPQWAQAPANSAKPQNTPVPTASPIPTPPLPTSVQLTGGTQVFQTFNNCGPASLSMALSYYGIVESQITLGQKLRPYQHPQGDNDDKSVTLSELAQIAAEYGFAVYYRPAGSIDILKQLLNLELPVITRTLLTNQDDIGHYRVITGYDEASMTITQDDSLQGANLTFSYQDFNTLWQPFNYEFLVLVPMEKSAQTEKILGTLIKSSAAWEQALVISDQAIEADPADIYSYFNRAVAHYHLGQYEDSIESFEAAKDQLPDRMLWYQLDPLLAYYQVGDYDTVLRTSQTILDNQNQAYAELHYLQSLVYQGRGQTDLAQAALARAHTYNLPDGYWLTNVESIH